jgi:uncharacterized membrane protein
MNEVASEAVNKLLAELASKFGTTVEYLWGALVRQSFIEGVGNIIASIVFFLLIMIAPRFIKKIPEDVALDGPSVLGMVAWVVYAFITIMGATIILCSLSGNVSMIINPEFHALKYLL